MKSLQDTVNEIAGMLGDDRWHVAPAPSQGTVIVCNAIFDARMVVSVQEWNQRKTEDDKKSLLLMRMEQMRQNLELAICELRQKIGA